jgi:integrase
LDEVEQNLFNEMKVIYQTGKGNHLVPFLVPRDTIAALDKLCDAETRNVSGISNRNRYLFPSTQGSADHVYGWYAVHKICLEAGVDNPTLMTATKMRHRISTLYAGLEIPEAQRAHFYKHMGHSGNINASIYQAPLAEIEITQVGRVLQMFDNRSATDSATAPDANVNFSNAASGIATNLAVEDAENDEEAVEIQSTASKEKR